MKISGLGRGRIGFGWKSLALGAACLMTGASAAVGSSGVLKVDAPIVAVVPLTEAAPPICDVPPPARSAGLVAMLKWDLEARCRDNPAPAVVRGYQVDYEWDGRRFSTQMDAEPAGDTLPLQLKIQ